MNQPPTNPTLVLIFLAGALIIGIVIIFVGLPLLGRFSLLFEALGLLADGVGEYFGNPGLVRLGCLVIVLMIAGCCIITIAGAGAVVSCATGSSAAICRLFGR